MQPNNINIFDKTDAELPDAQYNYYNSFISEVYFNYIDTTANTNLLMNLDLNKVLGSEMNQGKKFAIQLKAISYMNVCFNYQTSLSTPTYFSYPSMYLLSDINNPDPTYYYKQDTQNQQLPITIVGKNIQALIQTEIHPLYDPVNSFGTGNLNGNVPWSKKVQLNGKQQVKFYLQQTDPNGNFVSISTNMFKLVTNSKIILCWDIYSYV